MESIYENILENKENNRSIIKNMLKKSNFYFIR